MKLLRNRWLVIVTLMVAGTVLYAQPDAGGPLVSDSEVMRTVAALKNQVRSDARHILYLQQVARKQNDVIKLNCVNDKLVQFKAVQNLFDRSTEELEGAMSAELTDRKQALFGEATAASSEAHRLRAEADACIGETELLAAESTTDFAGPDLEIPPEWDMPIEPPAYASPFN